MLTMMLHWFNFTLINLKAPQGENTGVHVYTDNQYMVDITLMNSDSVIFIAEYNKPHFFSGQA